MGLRLRAFGRAANSVRSPPPCGEGLGVGVSVGARASRHNYDPLPTPPPQGGREQTESAARFFLRASEQTAFAARIVIQGKQASVKATAISRLAFAFACDAARVAPRPMARRKRAAAPERRFRVGRFLRNLWPDHVPERAAWGWRARRLLRLLRTKPSRSLPPPR